MIATSQFTISVIKDGKDGAPGATGPQGVSVTKVVTEYRLSNSSTELTGSGTGYTWSETKPDIPSGKYLWERERTDLSNNTSEYGAAHCDIVISGLVFDVDRNSNAITSKVWESDIENHIYNDGSTMSDIQDRVTQTETDISGINTTISNVQTTLSTKADGSTVQTLTTRVNTISDTVDGHTQTISSNTSRIDDAEDEIESTKTIANQTANKFTWLVQSGTSASNFTLTSRVAELISPQVVIKDPAGSATIITGGKIQANSITTNMLKSDAIKSTNYTASSNASSPYSATGAFLDLNTGSLYMPNFGVNGTTGAAYFNGTVNANAGKFGDDTSYWNIETVYDYNMQPHAALVGTGSPYLQTGNWQVSDNAVATRKYTSTSESAGNATYYKDSGTNTFYDVGMKIPTNFGGYSASDSSVTRYNKAFYYGRKYTGNNIPSLDSDWTYFFEIDSGGNVITAGDVYEGGVKLSEKYAAITDVGSAYLPKTGGTITGNLTVNGSFTTNIMLQTNLGSTSSAQLTGAANAVVKPGVTGTLGVGNGGTGKSSWTANRLIYSSATNALSELSAGTSGQILKSNGSSAPSWVNQSTLSVGSAIKATQDGDGNVITDTYRALDDNQFDTIDITDAQVGNLIVTGAGRFTNGLYGDLTGNVVGDVSGSSTKVLDSGDSTPTTFAYSKSGLSTASWFAAWNGYELRAINPANARNSLQVMYSPKITTAATADTMTSEGLYRIAFSHSEDTTFPTSHWGDLFTSNHGTMYQIWMGDNSMAPYKRIYNNSEGTWGAWSNIWDIGATKDGNGNTISSTYLKLSGGTMTGDLVIKRSSTISANTPAQIHFQTIQTDNNITSNAYISVYDDHDAAGSGTNMVITSAGNMFIGGGESPSSLYSIYKDSNAESMFVTADTNVYIESNAQTIGNRLGMTLTSSHELLPVKAETKTNNVGSIGNSSYKWANVYATTLHGNLDDRTFTIGKTGKSVNWSADVSWSQAEISDCATNTANGWMSKDDKAKLDSITVSDIGTVGADSIRSATNGGIDVSISSGVATIKHSNQLSAGGTAQGTANNTTLTNGGSFTVPTITYDINGHITATGTNKINLPSITTITGNAGTATKFAAAQSVTLTGDTTGTASSQAGWSLATTTSHMTPTELKNADLDNYKTLVKTEFYYGAGGNGCTNVPSGVGSFGLMTYASAAGYVTQELGYGDSKYIRYYNSSTWSTWKKFLHSDNYTSYTVTKTGSGATGTWGISISGNAATATSATSATNATNATFLAHKTLDNTTINNTAGTFAFSGSGDPWEGCDWVGLQVGDNVDKFQITRYDTETLRGMIYRYNDSGGTNTSWTEWRRLLDDNNYPNYVVPKSGGTFTGVVYGTSFLASDYISANAGSGTDGGVNLYNRNNSMEYAIMFRKTSNQVKHGFVQSDWATYFTMGGDASNVGTRGWIFKDHVNSKGVASISGAGNMALNGELAIGTTGTDVSGSCSLVMDRNLSCLNFVFN